MDVYSTRQWRQGRTPFLIANPHCVDCGAPAQVRDHVPPRRVLEAAGIHDPDHPRWLRARCTSCHDRKTATTDRALLQRLDAGEDAHALAEEAMQQEQRSDQHRGGVTPLT